MFRLHTVCLSARTSFCALDEASSGAIAQIIAIQARDYRAFRTQRGNGVREIFRLNQGITELFRAPSCSLPGRWGERGREEQRCR